MSADDVSYLDPETIGGLNLYAYCSNNPVMNIDPEGNSIIAILLSIGIAALVGAVVGAAGTFVGDVVSSVVNDEWEMSSWETYAGNAIGGAIGGALSLIPVGGAYIGSVASSAIGTFAGAALEKATGKSDQSWKAIIAKSAFSSIIGFATAGLTKYAKIPGITKGSHSWQQVFRSGFTKAIKFGQSMSSKTLAKGAGYLFVSSLTNGFLVNSVTQPLLEHYLNIS